jgi:heptosyltransferase-1
MARTTPVGKKFGLAHATDGSSFEAPARWVADTAIAMDPHVSAVQRSRRVCAQALGYALTEGLRFGLTPAPLTRSTAREFEQRGPVVALVHGTSRADKQWPVCDWVELGRRLNHRGFTVALVHGSVAEHQTSLAIAAQLKDAWVWPPQGLDVLTDTLAHCAGVVGVDSGLSHIAVALDLPHVQIYNFDTAWRTGPEPATGASLAAPRQCSAFALPSPTVDTVWSAWKQVYLPDGPIR